MGLKEEIQYAYVASVWSLKKGLSLIATELQT